MWALKKLQSLGYVGGALEEDFSFDQDKADPKDTFQHHLDLMEIMGLMGTKEDLDAAEKACLAFISKGMEVAQVYVYLAQIAIAREDQPKAIDYLKKAVAVEPGTASAQAQLGVLLLDAEDYEQALVHLQEAHQIQPKSAMICYDVARAYYKLGQKEKAIEYCRKSLAKQPDYISPRANLAKALFELGDTPSAVNEYYKVIEYDAENLKALNFLAWIQATSRNGQLRKPQEALKLAMPRPATLNRRSPKPTKRSHWPNRRARRPWPSASPDAADSSKTDSHTMNSKELSGAAER
ncbi:MAG: tetratricopeptide repeat protein [Planctomycetota bacterium]|jgi:tetratricopeptide (TPR) repeat protein